MADTRDYTWRDLEDAIGRDFSGGVVRAGIEPLERTAIRRFCEPAEMDCPLFFDDDIARRHGYEGITCPLSMVQSLTSPGVWSPGAPTRWPTPERNIRAIGQGIEDLVAEPLPAPKTAAALATDREIEYILPVYLGDVLRQRGNKVISVAVRETSIGFGAFVAFESEIVNQWGKIVALARNGRYYYNPHPKGYVANQPPDADGPGAPARHRRPLPPARASYVDWSRQRYFEDVNVGDPVPPVVYNLPVQRLIIEAGANRDFSPFHHNAEAARAQRAPDMFANNGFIQAMWERVYREFIGLDGIVKKVGPFRMRRFNSVGESVVTQGVVKRKWREKGDSLVELELWSENSSGISVGPGPVLVRLPSKTGGQ